MKLFQCLKDKKQVGTVMLEGTITMALLVLLLTAVWDVGRVLNQYLSLTQIAYEGVRIASRTPSLEANSGSTWYTYDLTSLNCASPPALPAYHVDVHQKTLTIICALDDALDLSNIRVASRYDVSEDEVFFRIQADFTSAMFPIFSGLSVTVEHRGPYLF